MKKKGTKKRTLICIPTYNEIENLEAIIDAILDLVDVDILILDDNSPDGTGIKAARLAKESPSLFVLHREKKEGLGPAYMAGFKWGLERDYDLLVEMDADFSHQPKYLSPMLKAADYHDFIIGSRYVEGGGTQNWSLLRRFISRGGGLYARTLLGLSIQDLTAGFIVWNRHVLENINFKGVEASGYVFQIELKYKAKKHGFSHFEFPIVFPDREKGESKMAPGIALEALTRLWRVRLKK